jgi:twitching motility protein PilT
MQTMNQSLFYLFQKRLIALEEALGRSSDPDELKQMISNPSGGMQRRPPGR